MFSGPGIFYPDSPAIKGITEGKDELLEPAKQMIL